MTQVIDNHDESILFEESFQWSIGSAISSGEVLQIQLFNHNKYLSNK